jgi:NAD+ kinase
MLILSTLIENYRYKSGNLYGQSSFFVVKNLKLEINDIHSLNLFLFQERHVVNRIGIIVKRNKPDAITFASELIKWLSRRNIQVYVDEFIAPMINHPFSCPQSEISQNVDLLIVLGGDGTLLSAVRVMEGGNVPILGVNLGGLGFLTEITLEEVYPVLGQILEGKVETEKRMKLCADVLRQGERVSKYEVLNDVVINKSVLARIINLRHSVNGAYVTTYRGDGVIISTPTGSTAYSLSAGGPIVYPSMDSILITPICPHTLTNRPLLIPDGATVEITLESEEGDVRLTLDGQIGCDLHPFDQVVITKAKESVFFIKSPFKDYFQILRTKFKWGER